MRSASATGVAVADSLDAAMMGWRVRGPTRCRPSMQQPHTRAAPAPTRGAVSKKCVAERSSSAVCEAERVWRTKAVGSADLSGEALTGHPCTPVPLLPLLPASRNAEIHHYPQPLDCTRTKRRVPLPFMPVKKRHGVQELLLGVISIYLKRRGPATAAARERGGCDVWRSASWRPSRWHLHRARLRSAAPCVLAPCGPP